MGENEGVNAEMMQRLQSSFGTSSSSFLKQPLSMDQLTIPQFTPSQQMRASGTTTRVHHSYGVDGTRRAGIPIPPSHHPHQIPPISPYSHSHIPPSSSSSSSSSTSSRTLHHQAGSPTPTHTRSLSQPSFFSLDSLPPLSPSPFRDSSTSISDSADVSMEDRDVTSHSHSHSLLPPSSPFSAARGSNNSNTPLPVPRKSHRRSNSDIPFGFSNVVLNSSPPLIPLRGAAAAAAASNSSNPAQLIKKEDAEGSGEKKFSPEGEVVVDDLFSAYMNLDNINDALNNNSSDEKNGTENNDLDSRASGTKTNNTGGGDSSDNEAESSVNEQGGGGGGGGGGGVKRSAGGDVVLSAGTPTSRHYRSVSMDSFIGKLSFSDHDSLPNKTMMPPSSPGSRPGLVSSPSSNGVDGNSSGFSLEFGNGEFSGSELKKIMANEKLAEIAMTDPKRAKRILANRQSAARSKERKMRYISELEHKVQTLQTEATTLSAQLTLLQRDSVGLTNQNSELKFRLQSMEQQAKLRDALNEALTAEVHRLKLATAELNSESHPSSCLVLQHSVNPLMFQQQPRKASQQNIHLQQQQQQLPQQQNGNGNSQTDLKQ